MTLRERIRRLRHYYQSTPVFRECLQEPALARWLPWRPADELVDVRFASGRTLRLRAALWPLLPTACRLDRIGAEFEFLEDAKCVRLDGLTLYSPLWTRNEYDYYKDVILEDVYGVRARDLAGATAIDVGAYVGDSSLAFARRGARVHALEPSDALCTFIRRNAAANGLDGRIVVHEVGLSDRRHTVQGRHDRLQFEEGVAYALEKLPGRVDLLKLDCEGAEYHLLADPRFLDHLAPREIRMEYHRGPEDVVRALERAGYAVTLRDPAAFLGLAEARRKT
jgi:hypothetical protein